MADSDQKRDASANATVVEIIGRLQERLVEVTARTKRVLVGEIAELREDPQLMAMLSDTVTANIETIFAAIRNGIPLNQIEPPSLALEYARRLAQRDIPANVLVRAYRIGHQTVLETMLSEIRKCGLDAESALDVTDRLTADTFDYIDWISQRVITTYHDERDRWHGSRNYVRASHVRDLLEGGDNDIDAMTMLIQYPLRRVHLALVAWCDESPAGNETVLLEQFIQRLAASVGDREACLYIPADRLTAWAWIPFPIDKSPDASARIREIVAAADDSPFVSIGRPLAGLAGFRRSHQQALEARSVALNNHARADRVIEAGDPGILLAGLLGENVETARRWVREVLGPLASITEQDDRLRETLRTFLRTGSSFKASAAELHLHFNTVRYRVGRAVQRRGRAIDDDRLDVEVALLLCQLLGDTVLSER
ncbi:CdaR family transcriptional regulator [Antrihabitans sp. YC2-6]|uniref:PucR family transcriptional regulator n=1 Tax=Antrihabitans sp. YC2-6 TaxID=2799498 RepID=UPI0018F7045C|nr:helix-turn-helix domain-containing protein [Antrihabitans sp. YC2-6]MBJ8344658.1 helix-turn-helix domain-containing protein [Antrihabitans sp. YC2-6]